MATEKKVRTRSLALWGASAVLVALPAGRASSLELGFEARAAVQHSDNIDALGPGDEEPGTLGFGTVGVYGEQDGRGVRAAFTGELEARRRFDGEDDDLDAISRFLGAAEFRLTPRASTWYVGDALGSVRVDEGSQPIDDFDTRTRNVFVTGPGLELEPDPFSRFEARALYLDQSEDGDRLESLYNVFAEYRRERVEGASWGLKLSDVYTDADAARRGTVRDDGSVRAEGSSFNRVSASAFAGRSRGLDEFTGELGATRYDPDGEDAETGLLVEFGASRRLGRENTVGITFGRDLVDRSLGTVEGLLADGVGEERNVAGIYERTRLGLSWALKTALTSVDAGVGLTDIDYRVLTGDDAVAGSADDQDRSQDFAYARASRVLGPRWRLQLGARYVRERFDERPDESDSLLADVMMVYLLSRSFELEASYVFDRVDGDRSLRGPDGLVAESLDSTENRFGLGLRWAPPSRASQDLTVELKSLIR